MHTWAATMHLPSVSMLTNILQIIIILTCKPTHSASSNGAMPQILQLSCKKWRIHYASFPAMFNPFHGSAKQKCLKSTCTIKVAIMKNTDDLYYAKEATTKLTLLLSAKTNGTQRKTLISQRRMLVHTTVCQKAPFGLKWHRTVKKINP